MLLSLIPGPNFMFFLPSSCRRKSFYLGQGGSLAFTVYLKLVINHPQPSIVFFQCTGSLQQQPSNSVIFKITTSSEPLKYLRYYSHQSVPSTSIPFQFTTGKSFNNCTARACQGPFILPPTTSDGVLITNWPVGVTTPKSHLRVCFLGTTLSTNNNSRSSFLETD